MISLTYDQTLKLRPDSLANSAAITLMGTDVERIVTSLRTIHELWASPVEVGVALWFLERNLGISCLVPFFISLGIAVFDLDFDKL